MTRIIAKAYPYLLLLSIAAGLFLPTPPAWIKSANLFLIGLLIFFPTLKIQPRHTWESIRAKAALLPGSLAFMFVLLPLIVYALGALAGLERSILVSLVLTAAAPSMLSTPYLSESIGGDVQLSWAMAVTSTLLAPLALSAIVPLLVPGYQGSLVAAMAGTVLLVLILPAALAFGLRRASPSIAARLCAIQDPFMQLAIVLITWMMIGFNRDTIIKMNFAAFLEILAAVLALVIGQYLLFRRFAARWLNPGLSRSLAVNFCLRNAALVGGVLVLFDASLAFVFSIGALVNALLFLIIHWRRDRL
jgi:predicted Na+-dependent transporter